jgi:hypothetical protein
MRRWDVVTLQNETVNAALARGRMMSVAYFGGNVLKMRP